jgi:ATP-dependent Clp protease ATP-binding subunit ClpX
LYFSRDQAAAFHATLAQEEERWDEELQRKEDAAPGDAVGTFEEYRKAGAGAGAF